MIYTLNRSSIESLLTYHITKIALVKIPTLQVAKSTSTVLFSFYLIPLPSLLQLITSFLLKQVRARFLTKYVKKTPAKVFPEFPFSSSQDWISWPLLLQESLENWVTGFLCWFRWIINHIFLYLCLNECWALIKDNWNNFTNQWLSMRGEYYNVNRGKLYKIAKLHNIVHRL